VWVSLTQMRICFQSVFICGRIQGFSNVTLDSTPNFL